MEGGGGQPGDGEVWRESGAVSGASKHQQGGIWSETCAQNPRFGAWERKDQGRIKEEEDKTPAANLGQTSRHSTADPQHKQTHTQGPQPAQQSSQRPPGRVAAAPLHS